MESTHRNGTKMSKGSDETTPLRATGKVWFAALSVFSSSLKHSPWSFEIQQSEHYLLVVGVKNASHQREKTGGKQRWSSFNGY